MLNPQPKNIPSAMRPLAKVWPAQYTGMALAFVFFLILSFYAFFGIYMMPPFLLLFGLAVILFFFGALRNYSLTWSRIPLQRFDKKLFWHSFFYRLIFVGIMYLLTYLLAPHNFPFEIDAADSWTYHLAGLRVAEGIPTGDLTSGVNYYLGDRADLGFPIYIGFHYFIFGPTTITVRIFNALFGSLTVRYIARITRAVFGEAQARLAGIIAMLMPPLLWFGGMHLKETLMIFLVVSIFYRVTNIVEYGKLNIFSVSLTALFSLLLFFFRTVLAFLVIFCVAAYFLLNFTKKSVNKGVLIVAFVAFIFIVSQVAGIYGFQEQINPLLNQGTKQFGSELAHSAKQRGLTYNQALVAPFILIGSVVTPFPSLLDFEERQLGIYIHFQNEVIRNIMYFFAFFGIIYALRKKFRASSLIFLFTLGYVVILAAAALSFNDRYQLPALPFIIIFISEGFCDSKSPMMGKWLFYLVLIFIAIFAWNYFKLSIRGLI